MSQRSEIKRAFRAYLGYLATFRAMGDHEAYAWAEREARAMQDELERLRMVGQRS